jgi:hypothetical protein
MRVRITQWLLVGLFAVETMGWAQQFQIESVGGRYGMSVNHRTDTFNQAEAFTTFRLPWSWDLGYDWHLRSRLDLSAGWMNGRDYGAFIATVGPSLVLGQAKFPLSLDIGISPTILSRDEFGRKDFGVPFQFTSHAGVNCDLGHHVSLGYRIQHMSNAHLSSNNPGLNLHMFAISLGF